MRASYTLDETTRSELRKWQIDFVYRGGELWSNRPAAVSREGLVPDLQIPAEKPDITWIPKIMRSKGWNEGATLMEEWFRRPALVRADDPKTVPIEFGPPLLNVIKMDWVLRFDRARDVYDQMMNGKMWKTPKAKTKLSEMFGKAGVTARLKAAQGAELPFGDLDSANVLSIERNYYFQSLKVTESDYYRGMNFVFNSFDGLTAALADFNLHMAVKGKAKLTAEGIQVTVEEVGVYVQDSYDFVTKGQPLGRWEGINNLVTNDDFSEWRKNNSKGGDFLVYSDIKKTSLTPPETFVIPL